VLMSGPAEISFTGKLARDMLTPDSAS
jgi:hypothetical protein